ncbi:MAG: PAS domain-containing protein [Alphaproteobacteria bacterium]|nr:PAS domain-containing protein [Alphaproteobacteria bacterium]MBV9694000.1 PAS domain-containing protein [Alphaproteobacteria bacterium]
MDLARGAAAAFNLEAQRNGWNSLCDVTLSFVQPDLARLREIWDSEAGEAGVPARKAMSPRLLKSFLRDVALYERVDVAGEKRRYRVRLMGTAFAQILGDLTGQFVDEAVPEEVLALWHASLDTTLAARAPLRFLGREDTNSMTFLTGEFFSAPLLADDGEMSMVLGAARYSGKRPWEDIAAEARRQLGLQP